MKRLLALALLLAPVAQAQEHLFSPSEMPEAWCLAQNIYYEARSSNYADRAGVADVVMNRVNDSRYPNTICEVVKQGEKNWDGSMVRNRCAFSWYCDGKSDWPTETDAWRSAQQLAYSMVIFGAFRGISEGATHYHAHYIDDPDWAQDLQLVGRIGEHIYYRWP